MQVNVCLAARACAELDLLQSGPVAAGPDYSEKCAWSLVCRVSQAPADCQHWMSNPQHSFSFFGASTRPAPASHMTCTVRTKTGTKGHSLA